MIRKTEIKFLLLLKDLHIITLDNPTASAMGKKILALLALVAISK